MANITNTSVVSEARGKIGTEVYSRNRGGAYVKQFAAPSHPASTARSTAENRFATVMANWATFSENQMLQWDSLAEQISLKNKVSNPIKLTGRNLYVQRAMHGLYGGGGISVEPTMSTGLKDLHIIWDISAPFNLKYSFDKNYSSLPFGLVHYSNIDQPLTVRSINSIPLYKFYTGTFVSTTITNVRSSWSSRFGPAAIPSNRAFFIRTKVIDLNNGQVVATFHERIISG